MFKTVFVHKFVYGALYFDHWHTLSISEGTGISVAGCYQAGSLFPLQIFERATSSYRTTSEGASAKPFAAVYSIIQISYCRRARIE